MSNAYGFIANNKVFCYDSADTKAFLLRRAKSPYVYWELPLPVGVLPNFLSFGESCLCVLDSDKNLWLKGSFGVESDSNYQHYFGLTKVASDVATVASGEWFTAYVDVNGDIYICGSVDDINFPVFTKLSANVKFSKLSCGRQHLCALDVDGNVWILGGSLVTGKTSSDLSLIKTNSKAKDISCTGFSIIFCDVDGKLWALGRIEEDLDYGANFQQIKVPSRIIKLNAAWQHALMIDTEGKLYGLGCNRYKQLGLDNIESTKECLLLPTDAKIDQVACFMCHSLIRDINGFISIAGNFSLETQPSWHGLGSFEEEPRILPFN